MGSTGDDWDDYDHWCAATTGPMNAGRAFAFTSSTGPPPADARVLRRDVAHDLRARAAALLRRAEAAEARVFRREPPERAIRIREDP